MQFKPGQSGNILGKPKGTKDHSWAKISFWFEELKKDWSKLTPNQRSHYSIELMKMLTSKMKALPIDPNDSVFNAAEAMDTLKQIESRTQPKVNIDKTAP